MKIKTLPLYQQIMISSHILKREQEGPERYTVVRHLFALHAADLRQTQFDFWHLIGSPELVRNDF